MTPEDHHARSQETLAAVRRMEDGLAAGELDMTRYFHEDFLWRGNTGCGTKKGVEAFRQHWQKPLRAAFTDRDYRTEHFMADGEQHVAGRHAAEHRLGFEVRGLDRRAEIEWRRPIHANPPFPENIG